MIKTSYQNSYNNLKELSGAKSLNKHFDLVKDKNRETSINFGDNYMTP